jgi:predicted RNase H-like HicB family nuclease
MRTVSVLYNKNEENWWAESPDAPGWRAIGATLDEVRGLAREGITFFLDEEVVIREVGVPSIATPEPQVTPAIRQAFEKVTLATPTTVPA